MISFKRIDQTWCNWPAQPKCLIEIIGGSYLATSPNLSYRRLIEKLTNYNFAVHAWSYIPGLDHQTQANDAWKSLRNCKQKLQIRIGRELQSIRLGHSLGCKLHLLAPDGGRNCKALIALSFNNFTAEKSIPMLGELGQKLGFKSEFSPSPKETLRLVYSHYLQRNNLLVKFLDDHLDQSDELLACLNRRTFDSSDILTLEGNHLTPASAGIRKSIFGNLSNDEYKTITLNKLAEAINNWSSKFSGSEFI